MAPATRWRRAASSTHFSKPVGGEMASQLAGHLLVADGGGVGGLELDQVDAARCRRSRSAKRPARSIDQRIAGHAVAEVDTGLPTRLHDRIVEDRASAAAADAAASATAARSRRAGTLPPRPGHQVVPVGTEIGSAGRRGPQRGHGVADDVELATGALLALGEGSARRPRRTGDGPARPWRPASPPSRPRSPGRSRPGRHRARRPAGPTRARRSSRSAPPRATSASFVLEPHAAHRWPG